ncbi:hypothetical protein ACFY1U_28860 [Streptomyces sp. NPDC001351]|uniref:hypothetical protein n=1 Tax=Streptomyces sp. NPDC001351 TaxID=3364564 RepID=UPI00369C02A7
MRFTPGDASDDPEAVEDLLRRPHLQDLLKVCRVCPFRAECIRLVRPRASRFDGISGGRLWFNGQIRATCESADPGELAEGASPITHGTESGARAHTRRGERACSLCREAARIAQARRRERKHPSGP